MVVAGNSVGGDTGDVEIVDLSSGSNCIKPEDLPVAKESMATTFIDGEALACGGFETYDVCYKYSFENNSWYEAPFRLIEGRGQSANALLPNNSFLITGGRSGLSSTELLVEAEFQQGPEMPEGRHFHCGVLINSTHFISTGGWTYHAEVYLLELSTGEWTQLPDMTHGRGRHACGLINGEEVVVAGGYTAERSSEIFSFETMSWREGPNLPIQIDAAAR